MNNSIEMQDPKSTEKVAELLLKIKAVTFRPHKPFQLASGKPSPVYVDCRRIISYPKERNIIISLLADKVSSIHRTVAPINSIAGGETAGIPFAAFVAANLELPMSYVRKKPKGYGHNAQIEGVVEKGDHILLVEDLATDGESKIKFVQAIRNAGATCNHTLVVLGYSIFPEKEQHLIQVGLNLHRLCRLEDVYMAAVRKKYLKEEEAHSVSEFIANPKIWQSKNKF